MDQSRLLHERLAQVPKKPGVYLWKNELNQIIYVGKANNLFKRMHQYFKGSINSYKTTKLVSEISDFDFVVKDNESSALILEKQYIEKYKPKYNINLKDDKTYSYIKVAIKNKKIEIKSSPKINLNTANTFYYGPITAGFKRKELINVLVRNFLFHNGFEINQRNEKELQTTYHEIINVLKLKNNDFIKQLYNKRDQASQRMDFEVAIEYRDSIELLEQMKKRQVSEISNKKNIDVFVFKHIDNTIHVFEMSFCFGVQVAHRYFFIDSLVNEQNDINEILEQYYLKHSQADLIVLDPKYVDWDFGFLSKKMVFPKIGTLKNLLNQAYDNLKYSFEQKYLKLQSQQLKVQECFKKLEQLLSLNKPIHRIFIFDNSNLNNNFVVGVGMAFDVHGNIKTLNRKFDINKLIETKGKRADTEYMFYNVKNYLSINEFLFKDYGYDDLFVVDGGITQIRAFLKALDSIPFLDKNKINLIGLVKDDNHNTREIVVRNNSQLKIEQIDLFNYLSFLQSKVDQYAKEYFRSKYLNASLESKLSQIKGVGIASEIKLLKNFKDFASIYNATQEQLAQVVGAKIAKIIKENL
ncbi:MULTISPECIES: GIY-YIG nuclease family protein [unclassified Mycoplasma]|uniref:GIY-YIG nuclease family protein n=1 Tax=unclassified Mycoplasma TaxID=2683645 RepID=UPI00211BBCA9|nr:MULTISPECIES: GIY-YIG nuclease family protein [unclassified Mycoplasma]UUM19577.1 GIY-YIG nuclease family protein [Mycoplasma sp. 1578d]UUM24496.1 GIY-YIG nuclease family protein [Mycoplasma sp. 3686d]